MSGPCPRWLVLLAVTGPCGPAGCGLSHEYRPMRVLVRDAETKEPVPGAEVEGWYFTMLDVFGPFRPEGVTDANGVTTLWVGPDRGFTLRVDEPGYLMTDADKDHRYFLTLPKKGGPNDDPRRIDHVIDLPPSPKPTFVVVVPKGYRGLLRVRFEPTEDASFTPQRTYIVRADQDGRVVVRVPKSVYLTEHGREIAARERDGAKVPWDARCPRSEEVALRHLGSTEDTELCLIGTGPEAEAIYKRILRQGPDGNSELDRAAYRALVEEARVTATTPSASSGPPSAGPRRPALPSAPPP
jgi:hypothetical protein